ncbi:MAG TPA: hypothetical protein VLJ80_05360 [Solirubrobacteraceae bacterium]|nr:hypothetical protein [Solirubrobacteraceae bacterium]
MPDQFDDILREAVLAPEAVDTDAIRAAVKPVGPKIKLPLVLDVVRLAHHRTVTVAGDEAFRKAINAKEPVIEASGQAQFLSILATLTLINAFSLNTNADFGVTAAALAVRSVQFANWSPAHIDLRPHADRWLAFRARAARVMPPFPGQPAKLAAPEGFDAVEQSMPALSAAIQKTGSELVDRERHALAAVGALSTTVAARDLIAQEERSFLWWLLSAWTVSDKNMMAVLAASELSSLTRLLPGPPASDELLRRKLGPVFDEPIELGALPKVAADLTAPGLALDIPEGTTDFFPLLGILRGGDPGLVEPFELPAGVIAQSLYDEAMLAYSIRSLA